jgi:hypothetical protein
MENKPGGIKAELDKCTVNTYKELKLEELHKALEEMVKEYEKKGEKPFPIYYNTRVIVGGCDMPAEEFHEAMKKYVQKLDNNETNT